MSEDAYLLRRPEAWRKAQAFGRGTLIYGLVLIAFGVGIGILVLVREPSAHAPLFAVASGGGMLAWGLVLIGLAVPPHPHPPVLVNAVAVTPTNEPLPDDWVHLFRRRRMGRTFALGLGALSLYMLAIVVVTVWLVVDGTEDAGLLLFLGIPVLSAVVWGIYALREARSRRRLSTFGRAPTGFTLGASGVTVLEPHATRHIPWGDVSHVVATNARTRGGKSPLHPIVQLVVGSETVTLQINQHVASPAVVYTALATAVDDARFRSMLGDSRGQAVLEGWARDAVAPVAVPPG